MNVSLDFIQNSLQQIAEKCPERMAAFWNSKEIIKKHTNCVKQLKPPYALNCRMMGPIPFSQVTIDKCKAHPFAKTLASELTHAVNKFIKDTTQTDQPFQCSFALGHEVHKIDCVSKDQMISLQIEAHMRNEDSYHIAYFELTQQKLENTIFKASGKFELNYNATSSFFRMIEYYLKDGKITLYDPNSFLSKTSQFISENGNMLFGAGLALGLTGIFYNQVKYTRLVKELKEKGIDVDQGLDKVPEEKRRELNKKTTLVNLACIPVGICGALLLNKNCF